VVFGILQMSVALLGQSFERTVIDNVLTIASITTGVILGVFFLGSTEQARGRGRRAARRRGRPRRGAGPALRAGFRLPFQVAWPWYALIGSLHDAHGRLPVRTPGQTLTFLLARGHEAM
jgi:hypothetical protein